MRAGGMLKEKGFDFKFNVEYTHLNDTWSSNDLEQIKVQIVCTLDLDSFDKLCSIV